MLRASEVPAGQAKILFHKRCGAHKERFTWILRKSGTSSKLTLLCARQTWGISGVEDPGSLQLEQSQHRAARKRSMAAAEGKQLHRTWNGYFV